MPPEYAEGATACKTVLAASVAKDLLNEVRSGLAAVGVQPHLVGFLANDDPAAAKYAEWTSRTCKENGFAYTLRHSSHSSIEDDILAANADPTVHGIMVYYPIFSSRQDQYLQNLVSIHKDVEGLSHTYISNLYHNIRFLDPPTQIQKSILPCTPLAIVKILEHLNIPNALLTPGNRLYGRNITVINRSEVVGRPLAALLANDGAAVYSVDRDSVQKFTRGSGARRRQHEVEELPGVALEDVLPLSDVVVSGVPVEGYKVPLGAVREGAVCVNFSSEKNFASAVREKASIYVPAVGKVTIVILLRNLLRIMHNARAESTGDDRTSEALEDAHIGTGYQKATSTR